MLHVLGQQISTVDLAVAIGSVVSGGLMRQTDINVVGLSLLKRTDPMS